MNERGSQRPVAGAWYTMRLRLAVVMIPIVQINIDGARCTAVVRRLQACCIHTDKPGSRLSTYRLKT